MARIESSMFIDPGDEELLIVRSLKTPDGKPFATVLVNDNPSSVIYFESLRQIGDYAENLKAKVMAKMKEQEGK